MTATISFMDGTNERPIKRSFSEREVLKYLCESNCLPEPEHDLSVTAYSKNLLYRDGGDESVYSIRAIRHFREPARIVSIQRVY